MNTVRRHPPQPATPSNNPTTQINSVYYGWAFLIACGGGSYYFAKRSINADRAERQKLENERRARANRSMLAATHAAAPSTSEGRLKRPQGGGAAVGGAVGGPGGVLAGGEDHGSNPSAEAGVDPAPTGHVGEGGKYEAEKPFRSRKGDRFS